LKSKSYSSRGISLNVGRGEELLSDSFKQLNPLSTEELRG